MAFFANRAVNLLNLHYTLMSLAARSGGVFVAAFMLRAGVPMAGVLCAYAAIYAVRFFLRPLALLTGKRVGLRPLIMIGAVALAGQYLVLPHVHGVGWPLVGVIAIAATSDAFYWTAYHAYFASMGDAEHRGHQISAREAAVAVIGVVAPVAGGFALNLFGPVTAFAITAVIQALSILPMLGAPDVGVKQEAPGAFRAALPGLRLFIADGWINAGNNIVWSLILFGALSESFTHFGGAVAAASLAGAVAGLLLGRNIDRGGGSRAVWVAFGAVAITVIAKALAITPVLAVAVNTMAALIGSFAAPTLMTAVYNISQRSPCPLRFQVAAESGADIGCGAGCLVAAGLISVGIPGHYVILLALAGAVTQLVILRRYYRDVGAEGFATQTETAV